MHHISLAKAKKPREIECLVKQRPHIWIAAKTPETSGESGIDRDKRDVIPVASEPGGQHVRLDPLPSEDVHAGRN